MFGIIFSGFHLICQGSPLDHWPLLLRPRPPLFYRHHGRHSSSNNRSINRSSTINRSISPRSSRSSSNHGRINSISHNRRCRAIGPLHKRRRRRGSRSDRRRSGVELKLTRTRMMTMALTGTRYRPTAP